MAQAPGFHKRGAVRVIAGVLAAVVVGGTLGLMWTEGWGAWEAFFVVLITITTVGYGDHGISPLGEMVASVVMLGGIGSFTFLLGEFVRSSVAASLNKERSMRSQIDRVSDHVIVCGLGRVGMIVCGMLHDGSRPFVAIDPDERKVERARELGYLAIMGDASEDRTLETCGIDRASTLVAVSSSDSSNIVITLSAHDLRPDLAIYSRVEHEESVRKVRRAGATHVISPTLVGGKRIADAILRPRIVERMEMLGENAAGVRVTEVHVSSGDALEGRTVGQVSEAHAGLVLVGVEHADGSVSTRPAPGTTIHAGDALIVAGEPAPLVRFVETAAAA